MNEQFERTIMMIGQSKWDRIANSHIAVFGVGGVGGFVAEFLVRTGIKQITLIDYDTIDISNINRQIIANTNNVGQSKVQVLKDRLLSINPDCVVLCKQCKYDQTTRDFCFDNQYDYVVDAIDMVTSKIDLVLTCKSKKIPIISAMGAGNKYGIPNFVITDIYKTSNDGLAKIMRKKLKQNGIDKLTVAYSNALVDYKSEEHVGSIVYCPACCASVLVAYVINKLIEGEKND